MDDPAGTNWNETEISLIVADYFDMRAKFLRGEPFVKARHYEELQRLTRRTKGSIERKYMNISAVLERLGLPWLKGYAPFRNFQSALIDAVETFVAKEWNIVELPSLPSREIQELRQIFIGPAPQKGEVLTSNNDALERLARKFDPAKRDERNRILGQKGEEQVYRSEIARLNTLGLHDLAKKVKWVSQVEGDGAGFDIRSFSETGEERLLEVKTTTGNNKTPFYLSRNERDFAEERADHFRIFRLYEFGKESKAFLIKPPLENELILEAANYKASFG